MALNENMAYLFEFTEVNYFAFHSQFMMSVTPLSVSYENVILYLSDLPSFLP